MGRTATSPKRLAKSSVENFILRKNLKAKKQIKKGKKFKKSAR